MPEELDRLLDGLSLEEIAVDPRGRVVINNPAIAERVRELGGRVRNPMDDVAWNGLCCGNSGGCGDEARLVDFLDRITHGRNPQR